MIKAEQNNKFKQLDNLKIEIFQNSQKSCHTFGQTCKQ